LNCFIAIEEISSTKQLFILKLFNKREVFKKTSQKFVHFESMKNMMMTDVNDKAIETQDGNLL
jgi:hypothetical protein